MSVARHALTLTTELEKVWSAALDDEQLEDAHLGNRAALQALANALIEETKERDRRLRDAGVEVTLEEWPPSPEFVLALDLDTMDAAQRFRLAMMSQLAAVQLLMRAIGPLTEPTGIEVDLVDRVTLRRWWESGGFALARSRARLLEVVAAELNAAERALLDGSTDSDERRWNRWAFEAAQSAGIAYARGDPEGALFHVVRSARATLAQVGGEVASSFTWDQLEVVPDLALMGQLLGRAQRYVDGMASSATATPAALLLAGAVVPHIQRWAVAPPREQIIAALGGDVAGEA